MANELIEFIKANKGITEVEFIHGRFENTYIVFKDVQSKAYTFPGWGIAVPFEGADEFFELCDFIGVDSDEVAKNGGVYTIKQSYIDFELWCGNTQVCGYYDQNNRLPQFRFTWYDRDGFECNSIEDTEPQIDEDTPQGFKTLVNWCMIINLVNHFDLVSVLLENRCNTEDVKITFGAEEHPIQVELWIKGNGE